MKWLTSKLTDHPRIRGEHPWSEPLPGVDDGSSPHTRGAPASRGSRPPTCRIIPAYAGSTGGWGAAARLSPDHPRIRGEHDHLASLIGPGRGSSPHTRGALLFHHQLQHRLGIIPAYAGSTPPSSAIRANHRDHPRIRGEHRRRLVGDRRGGRIIPAYAGSTTGPAPRRPRRGDHPRIRGEHLIVPLSTHFFLGSSPHTRGAHGRSDVEGRSRRIIPAYAGSTVHWSPERWRQWDHPRIRGEHRI